MSKKTSVELTLTHPKETFLVKIPVTQKYNTRLGRISTTIAVGLNINGNFEPATFGVCHTLNKIP